MDHVPLERKLHHVLLRELSTALKRTRGSVGLQAWLINCNPTVF